MYCNKCGTEKSEDEFNWKVKGQKRQSYCKPCQSDYTKNHYRRNKQPYLDRARQRNVLLRAEVVAKQIEYLQAHPCVDCGENDPIVLEFDHIGEKNMEISAMIRLHRSWEQILEEIKLCEVRCANCHRRKTAQQRGYTKLGALY